MKSRILKPRYQLRDWLKINSFMPKSVGKTVLTRDSNFIITSKQRSWILSDQRRHEDLTRLTIVNTIENAIWMEKLVLVWIACSSFIKGATWKPVVYANKSKKQINSNQSKRLIAIEKVKIESFGMSDYQINTKIKKRKRKKKRQKTLKFRIGDRFRMQMAQVNERNLKSKKNDHQVENQIPRTDGEHFHTDDFHWW